MTGYDIIGDVHGHADRLTELLATMDYVEAGGVWRHANRTAVFVGDLVDRGPRQLDTVTMVRAMVDAGTAHITMGNHEFNAVAYATWDPARGDHCRSRLGRKGDKHTRQHRHFLADVGLDTSRHRDVIDWFRTIPMWLDLALGDTRLRVVHACWHRPSIDHLTRRLATDDSILAIDILTGDSITDSITDSIDSTDSMLAGDSILTGGVLNDEIVIDATTPGTATHDAVEVVLKGPEVHLGGRTYEDNHGIRRSDARLRWWDPSATTLRQAALVPGNATEADGTAFAPLPDIDIDADGSLRYDEPIPVVFGHYWCTGTPAPTSATTACVDFSVGNGGPLVAYRWSGETRLTADHFVSS